MWFEGAMIVWVHFFGLLLLQTYFKNKPSVQSMVSRCSFAWCHKFYLLFDLLLSFSISFTGFRQIQTSVAVPPVKNAGWKGQ